MKSVFLLFLIVAARLTAATGDLTSCTVRSDGWSVDLVIEGFTTGATYDFDLDTNNVPTATTPYLTVVSEGYDSAGTLGTITRTVYLTKVVRKPYPDNATLNETGGGNLTVRIALSDYVYVDDNTGAGKSGTAPTVTLKSGFVVNAGGASQSSAAVTAGAVTNSSTAVYPKVEANGSRPPLDRIAGDFPLGVVAFHGQSAWNGASQVGPGKCNIACVVFSVADTHGHTVTTSPVTTPSIDSSYGDAVPVIEHVGTINVSTLDALDVLTANFIAYPVVGDAASLLDSSAGTAQPTPLVGPVTFVNDKSNTYGVTVACVDPAGNDSGGSIGVAVDIGSYVHGTTRPFLTIGKAAAAIAAYNNANHSRNDVGGGIVYLNPGSYDWTGSSNTYGGGNPSTWLTITRSASATQANAIISSRTGAGNASIRDRVKLQGITLTATTAAGCFSGHSWLWVDQCVINSASGVLFYTNTVWYVTRCTITSLSMGLRPYSTVNASPGIIRGNTLSGFTGSIITYNVLGNLTTGKQAISVIADYTSQTVPNTGGSVFAYNSFTGLNVASSPILGQSITPTPLGRAYVGNIFENYKNTSSPMVGIASDGGTVAATDPTDNIIFWNNTLAGQRNNFAYNDINAEAPRRRNWSVKNNIFYDDNIKSDTFSGTGGPNAARVENWPQLYGVGWSGNLMLDSGNGFNHEFNGLGTLFHDWAGSNQGAYVQFANYAGAIVGTSDGAGNGDYHLQAASPAIGLQRDWLMPYDISGTARGSTSAAGAYHFGTTSNFFQFFQ